MAESATIYRKWQWFGFLDDDHPVKCFSQKSPDCERQITYGLVPVDQPDAGHVRVWCVPCGRAEGLLVQD